MKKGSLNFLGRKNHSLFDTKIKPNPDLDNNVELVLDSSAIPESGTAKVRSRPTVKHFASSSDIVQGFAVPTPKVPIFPSFNGPKINGAVNGDRMSNGSVSVPDLVEGEILIPPPPTMAPPPPPPTMAPPPPPTFIPPPPDFIGNLDSSALHLQPPSIPPPKPPSSAHSEEEDLTFLKPPPMAPPKPPSTSSSASTSSLPISTPSPTSVLHTDIKECPKFTPPQPPQKTQKNPPPKPTRMSSIPCLDEPPQAPAPAPPGQTSTPSSFNPQHTAKLYSVPKTSLLKEKVEHEKKPKQILVLQDSESESFCVPLPVNGNTPSVAPPAKPARRNSSGTQLEKDIQDLEKNLVATLPTPQTQGHTNVETPPKEAQQEGNKRAPTPQKGSPEFQRASPVPLVVPEANQVKLEEPAGQRRSYSPFLDRKLRNLKGSEVHSAREGHAASPLALLMAAKEREKHRFSLACENSGKTSEPQPTASIQPSESNPNSFTVIPKAISSTSLTSLDRPSERPQSVVLVEPSLAILTPEPARITETLPVHPVKFTAGNSSFSRLVVEKQSKGQVSSLSDPVCDEENGGEQCMPLLPPPPDFANFDDEVVGSPPSMPAPDPPLMKALPPTTIPVLPVKAPSPSPPVAVPVLPVKAPSPSPSAAVPVLPVKAPSPSPPAAVPVLPVKAPSPSPPTAVPVLPVKTPCPPPPTKPKPPFQIKTTSPPVQPPLTSLSSSQATLLSILQKKMLEMDQKMPVPLNEAEASTDDWGSQNDEDTKVPVFPKVTPTPTFIPKSKGLTLPVPPKGLDMQELESKVAKKAQDVSSKVTTSSCGPHSKQPHGMTFTVRPGTKQPITLVSKGDSS